MRHELVSNAAVWWGSEEAVVFIDPATGEMEQLGVLGDLEWWASQLSYDRANRMVYALGHRGEHAHDSLYTLSLDTREATKVAIDRQDYATAPVALGERLIAAYWTGSEERVVFLDPTTGTPSPPVGILSDLAWWNGQLAFDWADRAVHAIGQNDQHVARPYRLGLGM